MITYKTTPSVIFTVLVITACRTPLPEKSTTTNTQPRPLEVPTVQIEQPNNEALASATPPTTKKDEVAQSLRDQAIVAMEGGSLVQAGRILDRALRIDARSPSTYYQYAKLRQLQSRPNDALRMIERGLSLRPNDETRTNLTTLREELKDNPESNGQP